VADENTIAHVLGTDRLGRPFTRAESMALQKAMLDGGYHEARHAALLFGVRLSGSVPTAEDLVQRAFLRIVRLGWNPAEVPLKERLTRLVWSEWTNWSSENARQRRAEGRFAHDETLSGRKTSASPQELGEQLAEEREQEAAATAQLEKLRAIFTKKGDTVNLAWLDFTLQGKTDLAEMALLSQRDVREFYDAAKRRKRIVLRLAAEAQGKSYDEEKEPQ
jgi:DNA-directed RNA polymerase specialized sigma24 family protein